MLITSPFLSPLTKFHPMIVALRRVRLVLRASPTYTATTHRQPRSFCQTRPFLSKKKMNCVAEKLF